MNKLYELLDFELSSYLESQKDYEYDIGVEGETIRLSMRYVGSVKSYPSSVICDFLNEDGKNICIINGLRNAYFQGIIRNYINSEIKNFETANAALEDTPASEKASLYSGVKSDKGAPHATPSSKPKKAPSSSRPKKPLPSGRLKKIGAPGKNLYRYNFLILTSCLVLLAYLSIAFTVFLFDHFRFSEDLNNKMDSFKGNNSFSSVYDGELDALKSNNSRALAILAGVSNELKSLSLDVRQIKQRMKETISEDNKKETISEEIFPPALVNSVKLNLRNKPKSSSLKLGEYKMGDKIVKILGKDADSLWLKVRLADDNEGWVFRRHLKLNVSLSNIPVVN